MASELPHCKRIVRDYFGIVPAISRIIKLFLLLFLRRSTTFFGEILVWDFVSWKSRSVHFPTWHVVKVVWAFYGLTGSVYFICKALLFPINKIPERTIFTITIFFYAYFVIQHFLAEMAIYKTERWYFIRLWDDIFFKLSDNILSNFFGWGNFWKQEKKKL